MVNSSEVKLRKVAEGELSRLVHLMEAHADFEQADFNYTHQEQRLKEKMFDTKDPLYCFVAAHKDTLVGYATCIRQYTSWEANYYLYVDCLYFDDAYRGMGLGYKMMQLIKEVAQQLKCEIIQWQTPAFNELAVRFYQKIGASSKSKERFYWRTPLK